ncbi:hypothetical protein COOONC_24723 [Cooperia oncophora]
MTNSPNTTEGRIEKLVGKDPLRCVPISVAYNGAELVPRLEIIHVLFDRFVAREMASRDRLVAEMQNAMREIEEACERYHRTRPRREYVRLEHVPFLDAYMQTFPPLYETTPMEFNLRLAGSLNHPINHASPISPGQRLFTFMR